MSIIRIIKRDPGYTQIGNVALNDRTISYECLGVLCYLLSKPADWQPRIADLIREGKNGRDQTYRIVRELVAVGYMRRIVENDEGGKFIGVSYEVYEQPHGWELTVYGNPGNGTAVYGKPDTTKKDPDKPKNIDGEDAPQKAKALSEAITAEHMASIVFPGVLNAPEFVAAAQRFRTFKATGKFGKPLSRRTLKTFIKDALKFGTAAKAIAAIDNHMSREHHWMYYPGEENKVTANSKAKGEPTGAALSWGKSDRAKWDHGPMTDEHRESAKKSLQEIKKNLKGGPRL